jgi:hypothetical protein
MWIKCSDGALINLDVVELIKVRKFENVYFVKAYFKGEDYLIKEFDDKASAQKLVDKIADAIRRERMVYEVV